MRRIRGAGAEREQRLEALLCASICALRARAPGGREQARVERDTSGAIVTPANLDGSTSAKSTSIAFEDKKALATASATIHSLRQIAISESLAEI